jgi:hypothetical protein
MRLVGLSFLFKRRKKTRLVEVYYMHLLPRILFRWFAGGFVDGYPAGAGGFGIDCLEPHFEFPFSMVEPEAHLVFER